MIYTSARFANAERTLVTGTDAHGNAETVPLEFTLFRLPEHGPQGFVAGGGVIADYVEPVPVVAPARPSLYAAVAISVQAGGITLIEQAAQFGQIMYEEGWLMAIFSDGADTANYLIFAQTDIPARVEQFRSEGSFELVFSDPATGDPVEPNRIDIQILKVR